jgi:hypothetical protein
MKADTGSLSENRSDVKAIEKTIVLNQLKIEIEKLNYYLSLVLTMFTCFLEMVRNNSHWWGWSQSYALVFKMNKANISSFKIKRKSDWQKKWS